MTPPAAGGEGAESERERVLALLRRHGWNANSFQALEPGISYFFEGDDACVAYVETAGAWVAAGAPIAPEARLAEVARRFQAEALRQGKRPRYFAVEERFLERTDLARTLVGAQPVWDPLEWEEILRGSRGLREQLRRARAKGVEVRLLASAELQDTARETRRGIDALIQRWLRSRKMAPLAFLVAVHPFSFSEERRYFVAERDGAVVGFLAVVPVFARGGWFLEDLLRDPRAPNGTTELLVDAAMKHLAQEGIRYATLGLAPLAGVGGWLGSAGRLGSGLYDFRGLHRFKARLRPQGWDPIYLAWPAKEKMLRPLADSLAAFAKGGLLRFGIETFVHARRRARSRQGL